MVVIGITDCHDIERCNRIYWAIIKKTYINYDVNNEKYIFSVISYHPLW